MALVKEKGNLRVTGIRSEQILSLLSTKHSKDVVVPECKNGETWGVRDLLKLDAWVLRRTYSPLTTIGYEIKVDRQDFEKDQKWTGYLDLCHEFYFVCPAGLIRETDIPQSVGLIWTTMNGESLRTKRKAERRNPDPEDLSRLLVYVLMSRSIIVSDMYAANEGKLPGENRLQQIRDTVESAAERKELAYFVRGHVRKLYDETTKRHYELSRREDAIKRFEERLAVLGITWNSKDNGWQHNMQVENEIAELKKHIDMDLLHSMKNIGQRLISAAENIEKYHRNSP